MSQYYFIIIIIFIEEGKSSSPACGTQTWTTRYTCLPKTRVELYPGNFHFNAGLKITASITMFYQLASLGCAEILKIAKLKTDPETSLKLNSFRGQNIWIRTKPYITFMDGFHPVINTYVHFPDRGFWYPKSRP